MAIDWLGTESPDAQRFASACVVIEYYLAHGGPKSAKLYRDKKPELAVVVPLREPT